MLTNPILITGMPKSFINLVTQGFYISGAWGGFLINTPDGIENTELFAEVTLPYFQKLNLNIGLDAVPSRTSPISLYPNLIEVVKSVIEEQGYSSGPWFYSTYRLVAVWQTWALAFPKARWIIVRRPDQDVINDCLSDNHMQTYRNAQGWQELITNYTDIFRTMKQELDVTEVWTDNILSGNYDTLELAVASCDLEFNTYAYRQLIGVEFANVG